MKKRDFLKYCIWSTGYCLCGTNGIELLASGNSGTKSLTAVPERQNQWSREVQFYRKTGEALQCSKCPNACLLFDTDVGICRNRVHRKGKMYSTAYGNPCAVHVDPIEKKPLYHFLPSTKAFSIAVAGCNLRCLNCQNWQISQVTPEETQNYDMMPDVVVDQCLRAECESIAYTYSEPTTFYEYAYDTAVIARHKNIKNVWKSNGYINEIPLRKLCKYLDAANIDLKGFDRDVYRKLNGADLDHVLRSLKIFKEEGVWLEITNLVIPGWTDTLTVIRRMCDWLCENGLSECPLHFSRFTPLYKLHQLPSTPVSTLEKARDAALSAGVKYVYIGNVPLHPADHTYCARCKRKVIERQGFFIAKNSLVNEHCPDCGEKIPGVWS